METVASPTHTTFEIIINLEANAHFSDLISIDLIERIRQSQIDLKQLIRERGSEHPSVLAGLNGLAENYISIYQFDKAETILRKTWVGYKRIYGTKNIIVPHTLSRLAYCWREQRIYQNAEIAYKEAVDGLELLVGEHNDETALVTEEYADTLSHLKKMAHSRLLYERLINHYDTYYSRENINCLRVVDKLAHIYLELQLSDEADRLCSESFDCCLKVFGADHPTTQSSVSILAELKYSQGNHAEAEKMYQMALECNLKALGPYHVDTIKIVNLIAEVLFNAQDFHAAEENYRKVLEGYEKALGSGCAQSFQAMHNIGKCLFQQKQLIDARMMLLRAFDGRSKLLGAQHLDTIYTLYELGIVYHFESHWRHKPDADATRRKAETSLFVSYSSSILCIRIHTNKQYIHTNNCGRYRRICFYLHTYVHIHTYIHTYIHTNIHTFIFNSIPVIYLCNI